MNISMVKNNSVLPRSGKWAQFIFNFIAPVYRKIDFINSIHYQNSIAFVNHEIGIKQKRILDIGTGTGDWAAMFQFYHASEIYGVDFALKMIEMGEKKNPSVKFSWADAENLSQFDDNSFDIVTASFVLHGVKYNRRQKIISEMKRVSRKHIVLHDFIGETPRIVQFLEFLERSDYKNFKKSIVSELKQHFSKVIIEKIKEGTGIYLAQK